jgi:hypothetical protein
MRVQHNDAINKYMQARSLSEQSTLYEHVTPPSTGRKCTSCHKFRHWDEFEASNTHFQLTLTPAARWMHLFYTYGGWVHPTHVPHAAGYMRSDMRRSKPSICVKLEHM